MTNQLTNYQKTQNLLAKPEMTSKLESMLGKKKVEGFKVSVLNILKNNQMLIDAEPTSVLFAAATAASLDLPVNENLGYAYIVPFRDNKAGVTKAQFQIGQKGIRQLALRSGQFKHINETDVREGELLSRDFLTGEIKFEWIQNAQERSTKKVIGYVSFFELTNGFKSTFYMSIEEVEEHAKTYSQTYKRGFGVWKDKFNAMALKTVSKLNLSKNAPLSIEMQSAITRDQSVIEDVDHEEYIDNPQIPSGEQAMQNQMKELESKLKKEEPKKKPEPKKEEPKKKEDKRESPKQEPKEESKEKIEESSERLKDIYELATNFEPPRKVMDKKPVWDEIDNLGIKHADVSDHLSETYNKHKNCDDLCKNGTAEEIVSVLENLI